MKLLNCILGFPSTECGRFGHPMMILSFGSARLVRCRGLGLHRSGRSRFVRRTRPVKTGVNALFRRPGDPCSSLISSGVYSTVEHAWQRHREVRLLALTFVFGNGGFKIVLRGI